MLSAITRSAGTRSMEGDADLLRIEGPDDARLLEPQDRDDVGNRTARHLIQILGCGRDYLAGR